MEDLKLIIWLLRSNLPGKTVVREIVETVISLLKLQFRVLDPEKLERLVESEAVSLAYDVAIGKIRLENENRFFRYLCVRFQRIFRNALAQKVITSGEDILFSDLGLELQDETRWEQRIEAYFYREGLKDDFCVTPARGTRKRGHTWKKTKMKAQALMNVRKFRPGCLPRKSGPTQRSLF